MLVILSSTLEILILKSLTHRTGYIKRAFFERVTKNNTDILEYVLVSVMEKDKSPQKKGLYRDTSLSLYTCLCVSHKQTIAPCSCILMKALFLTELYIFYKMMHGGNSF